MNVEADEVRKMAKYAGVRPFLSSRIKAALRN
jgi:hypothetical protein